MESPEGQELLDELARLLCSGRGHLIGCESQQPAAASAICAAIFSGEPDTKHIHTRASED